MHRRFDLVAVFQHARRIVLLEGVIVFVCARAELDFLDGDEGLLGFGLFLLLLLLVLPLAEVDDAANRRLRLWCDLDQIKPFAAGDLQRLSSRHASKSRPVAVKRTNLGPADALIDAHGRDTVAPVTKIPSS